jgi:hypothetical protein
VDEAGGMEYFLRKAGGFEKIGARTSGRSILAAWQEWTAYDISELSPMSLCSPGRCRSVVKAWKVLGGPGLRRDVDKG